MSDYISREAALKKLLQCADVYNPECSDITVAHAMRKISAIPAADVRPVVRGTWTVDKSGYPTVVCSVCGVRIPIVAWWCMDAHINYCPNCGAKMDGGQDDV